MAEFVQIVGAETGHVARLSLSHDRSQDALITQVHLSDGEGAPIWTGTLVTPLGEIRRAVMSALSNRVGWSFRGALKRGLSIAKRIGVKRVLRGVQTLANNPMLRAAASTVPGLETALRAYDQANRLLGQVRAGSREAQVKLLVIRKAAEAGSEKSQRALGMMRNMYGYFKQGKVCPPRVAVEGWLYAADYRSPLRARLDVSPGDALRQTYFRGSQLLHRMAG